MFPATRCLLCQAVGAGSREGGAGLALSRGMQWYLTAAEGVGQAAVATRCLTAGGPAYYLVNGNLVNQWQPHMRNSELYLL